jgi:hypothetical protein
MQYYSLREGEKTGHMRDALAYLHHAIDGRLRIKVPAVKGAPDKAVELERKLQRLENGINHVTVNPTTGSVLILYDSRQIGQQEIFESLERLGCRPRLSHESRPASDHNATGVAQEFGRDLARTVLHSTMEFALQRLIYALI